MKSNMSVHEKKAVIVKIANEILQAYKANKPATPIYLDCRRTAYRDYADFREKAYLFVFPYRCKKSVIKKIEPICLKGRTGGYKGVRVIYEDGSVVEELE